MSLKNVFLETKSSDYQITVFCPRPKTLAAIVQDSQGRKIKIEPHQIKCGLEGITSHADFLGQPEVNSKLKRAAVVHSMKEGLEVWIFDAPEIAIPVIKKGQEELRQNKIEPALKSFEIAMQMIKKQKAPDKELSHIIRQLKKGLFLQQTDQQAAQYLNGEEVDSFQQIVQMYEKETNPFTHLSGYIQAVEIEEPHLFYLKALIHEYEGDFAGAVSYYLKLALKHKNPVLSLKKCEELLKKVSDPFAIAHFLEKLDRNWLVECLERRDDLELEKILQHKDFIRVTFEECLAKLDKMSSQIRAPTCFICFNLDEGDVTQWLEHTLVPDLDRIGIKPIVCFRSFGPGKELNSFQGFIRDADLVIIVCTPELKRKCDERKKAVTGVAQEIRLAKERYNDPEKYETIFPIYMKGDRKESCPSEFFEPILGTNLTILDRSQEASVFSYYASAFELFGQMRGIPREETRKMKQEFLTRISKNSEIDLTELEKWRKERLLRTEESIKSVEERVSKKIQMINLPEALHDFTGRKEELEQLHEACKKKRRVAVTGLGGVGKTVLVLKYSNSYKSHYQFIHFIPAGTRKLIWDGLLQLADDLHIPQGKKPEDRLMLLKKTLDRMENEYLLIFDGVDQVEAFEEITHYLPDRGYCLVLTTRLPEQSRIRGFELIELKPFSQEDAIRYMLLATHSSDIKSTEKLVEKLGRLPLALNHAARYISSQKISIQKYLAEFNQYKFELFKEDYITLRPEEKTVLATWKMSIDAIKEKHHSHLAEDILEMIAFLGNTPISRDLIEAWFKHTFPKSSSLELGKALGLLCSYSMLRSPYENFYEVHPLVQSITRFKMSSQKQKEVFKSIVKTIIKIMQHFKANDPETWSHPKLCILHAIALFEKSDLINKLKSEQQFLFKDYLFDICCFFEDLQRASNVSESCLETAKKWEAKVHSKVSRKALATALNNQGVILHIRGKENQALENYCEALALRKSLYGNIHTEVAFCLNSIGAAFFSLGKSEEALKAHHEALEIWRALQGETHPDFARSLGNLGAVYRSMGRENEALAHYFQALSIWEKNLEENHPNFAHCLNNIGIALNAQGNVDGALKYHQRALEIRRALYGDRHPDVAHSLMNVAGNLKRIQGKATEALNHLHEALAIKQKLYGEIHPDVAICINSIGSTLQTHGKTEEALERYQCALKIWQQLYPENHPDIALCLNSIGSAYQAVGDAEKALENYTQALKIFREFYGEKHSHVATTLNNIGVSLRCLGREEEALTYHQKASEIWQFLYGDLHPNIATGANNTGSDLQALGKAEQALEYYRRALKVYQELYGDLHPYVGISLNNIGVSLRTLGKVEEALTSHQQALDLWKTLYGMTHINMGISAINIGNLFMDLKKWEEALDHFYLALRIHKTVVGAWHRDVADICVSIGMCLQKIGREIEALEFLDQASKIVEFHERKLASIPENKNQKEQDPSILIAYDRSRNREQNMKNEEKVLRKIQKSPKSKKMMANLRNIVLKKVKKAV